MNNEARTFEQTLRHDNPIVRDHHVHDVRTLPGVALLDIVHRLAPQCVGAGAIELRQVVFRQPVVTSARFDRTIVVTFTPADAHWRVTVGSYKSAGGQRQDDGLRENMECSVHRVADSGPARTLDVAAFMEAAEHRVDMNEVYGLALRADIKHFPFMKTLGTVYSHGSAELMHLRLGDEAERFRARFHAHPALLDGSTFAGQSVRVRQRDGDDDHTPYIPFSIQRLRIYQALPREVYTYSENEALWRAMGGPAPDVISSDIALFGADGELLAEFTRFSMKRIRSASLITSLLEDDQGGARRPGQPQRSAPPAPLEPADGATPRQGAGGAARPTVTSVIQARVAAALGQAPETVSLSDNFYDLGMDSTQLLGLTREMEAVLGQELYPTLLFEHSSIESLAAYLGAQFDTTALSEPTPLGSAAGAAAAGPAAAEEPEAKALLFVARRTPSAPASTPSGAVPRRHLLWLSEDLADQPGAAFKAALEAAAQADAVTYLSAPDAPVPLQLNDLLVQVVALVKDIVARPLTEDVLVQLAAPAAGGRSWAALFSGCFKTLAMEHPRIRSQILLVEGLPRQAPAAVAALLELEARGAARGAALVAYDEALQRRTTSTLVEAPQDAQPAGFDFREDGAYVIAGGLGGLGLILAEHLTTRMRPRLALLGRSPLDAAGREKLDHLTRQGAEVRYFQADLGDLAALRAAFGRIRSEFGPIAGIVHSAGIVKDQVIGRKRLDDIQCVVDSKIAGLWHLDQVSAQDDLDFFVSFSSLSAITGNIGQVDYASGNAFMDEFAFHRQAMVAAGLRHGRSLSINWPLWAEGGMAIGSGVERLLYQSSGLRPLPTAIGVRLFESALRSRETQVVVAYGDEARIRGLLAAEGALSTAPAGPGSPATDAASTTGRDRASPAATGAGDIAIIGMAGRYPQARDIREFYRNLKAGRDCITRVPTGRWAGYDFGYRIEDYYKFGGFVDGIDEFDPLLFGLPPVRAQALDPQARLFLQTAWEACEDAGFQADRKSHHYRGSGEQSVGVFVGAFWSHYELFGAESSIRGEPASFGVSLSSISNMTSYCMNLHGPSVAVDTMCSSALTSVHLACDSIRRDECQFAIAGGVNLTTHPHKLIFLQQNHFLSSEGVCRSFGENGDGYVPGEGVGAVMLTTLERALRLGYPIRGVIKGSAINHGGKTAGGTVPSPVAQAEVIADALTAADVDPRTLSYVEAHGTGTSLGDPIEIQGLSRAFARWTDDHQYCAIGSAKSNIGHLEAAAGIAGLTKVLLQFQHREIFPSLHAEKLNPLIPFHHSPFYVQTTGKEWARPEVGSAAGKFIAPRRALISAFGASGSNASMVLEEFLPAAAAPGAHARPAGRMVGILLSARDKDRLADSARRLLAALQEGDFQDHDLPAIACTLQLGREAMDERLAIIAASLPELAQKLQAVVGGADAVSGVHRGRVPRNNAAGVQRVADARHQAELSQWLADQAYPQLLAAWVEGEVVDWNRLYADGAPRRLHLPTYPFARDRHWLPSPQQGRAAAAPQPVVAQAGPTSPQPAAAVTGDPVCEPGVPGSPAPIVASTPAPRATRQVSLMPLAPASATTPLPTDATQTAAVDPSASLADPAASQPAPVPDLPVAGLERIKRSLKASLAATLFMEPQELGDDTSFLEVGVDSIIAVQWIKAVNAEFATSAKATVLYDHSTIEALATHLRAELAATAPAVPATAVESPPAEAQAPQPPPGAGQQATAAAADLAALRAALRASLAGVLFMPESEIDDAAAFTDLGMDSIIAVQWIKLVNAGHGTALKATVLYEQPSIDALALHLQEVLATEPPPATPQPGRRDDAAASTGPAAPAIVGWAENCAYALEGCANVSVSVVPLAPGFGLEVVAAGAGAPVVLLPPMGALATVWMHQVRDLSRSHRVLVFHYPGHGSSDFAAGRATFAAIAHDLYQALDAIGVHEPFHLVGWSIGALIAQKMALRQPARLRSLTLISAPARAAEGDSVEATIQVLANLANDFAAHVPVAAAGQREAQFDFVRAPLKLDRALPYLHETLNFDHAGTAFIDAETLVVCGAADSVISPDHGLLLASRIRHSRHARHEQGGHYVPLQNHEWFNGKLKDFFREIERGVRRPEGQVVDELPA